PKPRPGHGDAERMRVASQPTTQRLGGTGAVRNRTGRATRTGLMTAWAVLRTVVLISRNAGGKHSVRRRELAVVSRPDRLFNSTRRDWPLATPKRPFAATGRDGKTCPTADLRGGARPNWWKAALGMR